VHRQRPSASRWHTSSAVAATSTTAGASCRQHTPTVHVLLPSKPHQPDTTPRNAHPRGAGLAWLCTACQPQRYQQCVNRDACVLHSWKVPSPNPTRLFVQAALCWGGAFVCTHAPQRRPLRSSPHRPQHSAASARMQDSRQYPDMHCTVHTHSKLTKNGENMPKGLRPRQNTGTSVHTPLQQGQQAKPEAPKGSKSDL
jgi:hypothetical protein